MAQYDSLATDMYAAERLAPHPAPAGASVLTTEGGGHAFDSSSPPTPQHDHPAGGRREVGPRQKLSRLLSSNLVASGTFATGKTFDPRIHGNEEMPQACMPRIKLKAMGSSLALPLTKRQAEKLKLAQMSAGQERDVNADGVPETRLPWAVRPDIDFKIVNHKAWSAGVVAPVVRQVCMSGCTSERNAPLRFRCWLFGVGQSESKELACSQSLFALPLVSPTPMGILEFE